MDRLPFTFGGNSFAGVFNKRRNSHFRSLRQIVIDHAAQRMIGCPQYIFEHTQIGITYGFSLVLNRCFLGGGKGPCFVKNQGVYFGHLFDDQSVFEVAFFLTQNAQYIPKSKRSSQRQGTGTSHNEHRRKYIKGGLGVNKNPIAKARKSNKQQNRCEITTYGVGDGFVFLIHFFLKHLVAPQLREVTLRNRLQHFHLDYGSHLLAPGKNFIARFFGNGHCLAGYKTVINIRRRTDENAINWY